MKDNTLKELRESMEFVVRILVALLVSFFKSVTEVAWGLLGIFGFNALIFYLHETRDLDISLISPLFLQMEQAIVNNLIWFVVIFMFLFGYRYIQELRYKW